MDRMRPQAASRHSFAVQLLAGVALASSGCELVTNSADYELDSRPAYSGLCNVCPSSESLRHPPCPTESDAPDDGTSYAFAARALHLGADPAQWEGDNARKFDLGYDQDCSVRPDDGRPVACKPFTVESGLAVPWQRLPKGIDNSFSQRVLAPLHDLASQNGADADLDAAYSAASEEGRSGFVVEISNWNGTPDDPRVSIALHASPGVATDNGPMRWDGTDRWDLFGDLPGNESRYLRIESDDAYVSGGTLVLDHSSRGDVSMRFGTIEASFRVLVSGVAFVGRLSPKRLENMTMMAVASLAFLYESKDEVAEVLAECDPVKVDFMKKTLESLFMGAADMRLDARADADEFCDAVSVSWSFDAEPAKIGGYREVRYEPGCSGGAGN